MGINAVFVIDVTTVAFGLNWPAGKIEHGAVYNRSAG
jgi:hypothetical protein